MHRTDHEVKRDGKMREKLICGVVLITTSLVSLTIGGCHESSVEPAALQTGQALECNGFYGMPNERSGLSPDQCNTQCRCLAGTPADSQPDLSSPVFGYAHLNPPMLLTSDPYAASDEQISDENQVCTIELDHAAQAYFLQTLNADSVDVNRITHAGPCGACSSLADLAVYAANVDLTDPVRACGLEGIGGGSEMNITCLRELGFSEACAQIWYFNTNHTREICLGECIEHINSSYVDETGQLNSCLACDEENSGPIFKYFSGRTRRNSGLPSSICRPCDSITFVPHSYLK